MSKLIPGTFLHNIVYGNTTPVPERKPFYVQNAETLYSLLDCCRVSLLSENNSTSPQDQHVTLLFSPQS